jgi:glycosyltransferase involved in cell wall biosynthesis
MILAHLGHLAESGHNVLIRTGTLDTIFPLHPAIDIELLGAPSLGRTLFVALSQRYPDSCTVIATIVPLALLLRLRNRNNVVYFAQDYDETYYSSTVAKFFVRIAYLLGLTILKIPTIAVSEKLANLLKRKFAVPVEVACNGIDLEAFYHDPSSELLRECEGKKSILVLSRHDKRKGFDIAVDVIRRVAMKVSGPFEVWTVGEPAQGEFSGCLHRDFGYVDETRLRQILSSADLLLYPSLHEGFGLMVAEAFACKCAVVTTEAIPYAQDGHNALVSKVGDVDSLADNVYRILEGLVPVHELVDEGYRRVCSFSLSTATTAFEQFVKKASVR